jgi:WD40 repeat protein
MQFRAGAVKLAVAGLLILLTDLSARSQESSPAPGRTAPDLYGDPLPTGASARLGTVRLRCRGYAAFAPDGKTLATYGYDELLIWDVATGKELRRLPAKDRCCALAFSRDGTMLALAADGGTIVVVWNYVDGKVIHRFRTRDKGGFYVPRTHSLVFSADGKRLFSGDDRSAFVWNLESGKPVFRFMHQTEDKDAGTDTIVFSQDGRWLATVARVSGVSRHLQVWEVASGKRVHQFEVDKFGHCSATFSPKGDLLATASDDDKIRLWSMASGEEVQTLRGYRDQHASLAFSPDGQQLAVAANGGIGSTAIGVQKIVLWNLANKRILRIVSAPGVERIGFSPDGKLLAWESCGESVCLLNLATGKDLHGWPAHTGEILALAYSPDGKLLASGGGDNAIRLWKPETAQSVRTLEGHEGSVHAVAFSPDGKLLASGSRDHTAAIWDVASGKRLWTLNDYGNEVRAVAFAPDGKLVAVGGFNFKSVLWNSETGKEARTLQEEKDTTQTLAFTPDGKFLAVGGDTSVRLWDVAATITRRFSTEQHRVSSVAVSRDGKLLVAACDKKTFVWSIESGAVLTTLPGHWNDTGGVAFSPDGRFLVSASDGRWGGDDKNVQFWDVKTWREHRRVRPPLRRFHCLALSPDGKHLATGSELAEVLIWKLAEE